MKRLALLLLVTAVLCSDCGGSGTGGSPAAGNYKITREVMDTIVTITVVTDEGSRDSAEAAVKKAFDAIHEVDRLMSAYREDSEVSEINRDAFDRPVKVSDLTFNAIKRSVEISRETDGAFDITVGPLMRLWRAAEEAGTLPAEETIKATLKKVGGADNILLNEEEKTVRFLVEGMRIDLGGIAKGIAVDRAVEVLRAEGIKGAVVDAGGDLAATGRDKDGVKWVVGVRNFFRRKGHIERLALEDKAVATSGDYERFYEIDGVRYSHIIDPRTGLPVKGAASVSVIAPDCATADALATAAGVLGPSRAMALVEEGRMFAGCEILFASYTHGFPDHLAPAAE